MRPKMTHEHHDLHGDTGQVYEVYHLQVSGETWWEAVTAVPCPVSSCHQTLVWYEAGYVPGYRVCMQVHTDATGRLIEAQETRRHHFLARGHGGPDAAAVLIRDHCCEESQKLTVRLWWDEHDPTRPRWAYTVVRQQEAGHWQDIDRGALSDAAFNADTADELIQVFVAEHPAYATLDVVVDG